MAVRVVAASWRGRAWRLVVLLAVLAGLVPGVRLAVAADQGVSAGIGHVVWDEECSALPRLARIVEQPPVVPVVESSVLLVAGPSAAVAWVRDGVWEGPGRAWFAVSRAGRAPPFSSGI
ncbi:hypothetical protein [Actinocorallia libanotica]